MQKAQKGENNCCKTSSKIHTEKCAAKYAAKYMALQKNTCKAGSNEITFFGSHLKKGKVTSNSKILKISKLFKNLINVAIEKTHFKTICNKFPSLCQSCSRNICVTVLLICSLRPMPADTKLKSTLVTTFQQTKFNFNPYSKDYVQSNFIFRKEYKGTSLSIKHRDHHFET